MVQRYDHAPVIQPTHAGLEALEDGFCMVEPGGRVTYWNAAAERLLRVRRSEALGRPFLDVVPCIREGTEGETLQKIARDSASQRVMHVCPPRNGCGYLSFHIAPMGGGGLAVQFRDTTEEVRRADQYSALLESIPDGFLAVNPHWEIVYVNAVGEKLLRYPRARALGVSIWSLLPRGSSEIRECMRATMTDGGPRHLRDVQPEGRIFRGRAFDLWTHPLAGGGLSLLFRDVTERVQRERELARFVLEAEEASRVKSRFFAAISHELRTPLNAIVGYTHLLSTETYGPMPDPARRAADRASVCAEHLSRLVDDVLLLTTTEIGRLPVTPVHLNLATFLPAVIEPHRQQAEAKGLKFGLDLASDLPPIETDAQRLRQLLAALLSNAVKYTAAGEVRISAAVREVAGVRGEEYNLFPEPLMEFEVRDTGPGIAPEDRERIFGPFEQIGDPSRSESMSRGSGLGLTVARQLAGLLSGEIELAETSPQGSRFLLRLPLVLSRPT